MQWVSIVSWEILSNSSLIVQASPSFYDRDTYFQTDAFSSTLLHDFVRDIVQLPTF